jgi:hypothetical protein
MTMTMSIDAFSRKSVLEILHRLLNQASEVEADTGETPSAFEALDWAMSEIKGLQPLGRPSTWKASPQQALAAWRPSN